MRKIQVGDLVWYRREVPSYSYHEGQELGAGGNLSVFSKDSLGQELLNEY